MSDKTYIVEDNHLYNKDFYAWTIQQADIIKSGNLENLDRIHLLEELEIMSARERKELVSRLVILMLHLLKWQYQANYRGKSWITSIKVQRYDVADVVEINPSLKSYIDEAVSKAYPRAVLYAIKETNLSEDIFPVKCPWLYEQIIAKDFFPE